MSDRGKKTDSVFCWLDQDTIHMKCTKYVGKIKTRLGSFVNEVFFFFSFFFVGFAASQATRQATVQLRTFQSYVRNAT